MAISASYFGKSCNQLGIDEHVWQGCLSCSNPFGESTRVTGHSPFDQLENFRNSTVSHTILVEGGSCEFIQGYPASVASPSFPGSQFTMDCGLTLDNATLTVELDGRSFGLVQWRGGSAVEIIAASLVPGPISEGHLVVSINATNIGDSSSYGIKPMFCCYLRDNISSCLSNIVLSSTSRSLSSGDSVHVTAILSVANASLLWIVGCQVELVRQLEQEALAVIFVPIKQDDRATSLSSADSPLQGNEVLIGNLMLTFVSTNTSLNISDINAVKVR